MREIYLVVSGVNYESEEPIMAFSSKDKAEHFKCQLEASKRRQAKLPAGLEINPSKLKFIDYFSILEIDFDDAPSD